MGYSNDTLMSCPGDKKFVSSGSKEEMEYVEVSPTGLSREASFLLNRQKAERLSEQLHGRVTRYVELYSLLLNCPGSKLRPSELAIESIGDLSGLSQEKQAYVSMYWREFRSVK